MKLKHLLRLQYGSSLPAESREDGAVLVYGSNGPVGSHSSRNMNAPAVVVGRKGSHGKITWAEHGGFCIDTALYVDKNWTSSDLRYVFYLLQTLNLDEPSKDSAVPGLDRNDAYEREIREVDLAAQKAIADFLDRETARIDQLIEKKQRLLQLLEEQWLSRVERAVVAGIEDSSELQWTRDDLTDPIPGHWRVTTLRRLATDIQTGPFGSQLHSHEYVEGGIPVINPSHMVRRRISPDRKIAVDKSTWQRLERHVVYEGDILVARRGELGRCALVTEREVGWLCGTGSLRLRLRKDLVIPEFLVYALSTRRVSEWLSLQSVGSTMDNLNTGILGRLSLPVPPVSEQRQIVALLNSVEQTTEQLTLRIHESIERLKESRSSLITAAVTGQLDIAAWSKRGETERQLETVEAAV